MFFFIYIIFCILFLATIAALRNLIICLNNITKLIIININYNISLITIQASISNFVVKDYIIFNELMS